MGEKTKRFMNALKHTMNNLGSATEKTLSGLEQADKKINDKLSKISGEY